MINISCDRKKGVSFQVGCQIGHCGWLEDLPDPMFLGCSKLDNEKSPVFGLFCFLHRCCLQKKLS